jgi:outer membrane protein assembly factor BamB
VGGVLYTTLSQGCNGTRSGVYAIDLKDPNRPVKFFQSDTAGGGVWGRAGVAVSSDGLIFAATGDGPYDPAAGKYADTVLALTPKTLQLADYYTPANREWLTRRDLDISNVSPAIFRFHQWELAAVGGKEGVIYLIDVKSPGGPDHRKPLFRSPVYLNEAVDLAANGFWGGLASWEDAKGARWLYAPAWGPVHPKATPFPLTNGAVTSGSILAFRVQESGGRPVLVPAWISRDMRVPEPPVVANGLVFALESGEDVRQLNQDARAYTSQQRTEASTHAVLRVMDAGTGKELFNSGETMGSFTHFGGLALANGQVFATTFDNHLYAFGLPPE